MDRLSKEQRSLNMSKIKSTDTSLELKVRRYIFKNGFRYRVKSDIFGKPDIIFPKQKIAVFINGCFWHQHGCKKSALPKSNIEFWGNKLKNNVKRDIIVKSKLESEGWIVKRLWECELKKDFEVSIKELIELI